MFHEPPEQLPPAPGFAPVEPKHVLVEVAVKMVMAYSPMEGPQEPPFHKGDDQMGMLQHAILGHPNLDDMIESSLLERKISTLNQVVIGMWAS